MSKYFYSFIFLRNGLIRLIELQTETNFASPNDPPKSIWLTMWTRPRETMCRILDAPNNRLQISIIICFFLFYSYDIFFKINTEPTSSLPNLVITSIGSAILIYLLMTVSLYWIGKVIGGKGTYRDILLASLYSVIPSAILRLSTAIILSLYVYNVLPESIFINVLLQIFTIILYFWVMFIMVNFFAESHKISAWKALFLILFCLISIAIVIAVLLCYSPSGEGLCPVYFTVSVVSYTLSALRIPRTSNTLISACSCRRNIYACLVVFYCRSHTFLKKKYFSASQTYLSPPTTIAIC